MKRERERRACPRGCGGGGTFDKNGCIIVLIAHSHRAHEAFKEKVAAPNLECDLGVCIVSSYKESLLHTSYAKGATTDQISALLQVQLIVTTSSMYMTTFKHYSSLIDTAFRERE